MIAQKLYEGVNVGKEGLTGLITYMRTDSLRISPTANQELRNFIVQEYGKQYLSPNMRFYKKKGKSQDAHEAIRPTNITLTPKKLKPFLSKLIFVLIDISFVKLYCLPNPIQQSIHLLHLREDNTQPYRHVAEQSLSLQYYFHYL